MRDYPQFLNKKGGYLPCSYHVIARHSQQAVHISSRVCGDRLMDMLCSGLLIQLATAPEAPPTNQQTSLFHATTNSLIFRLGHREFSLFID